MHSVIPIVAIVWLSASLVAGGTRADDIIPSITAVREIAAPIALAWDINVTISYFDRNDILSEPGMISIGTRSLERLLADTSEEHRNTMVKLIVAHELWHQVQYHEHNIEPRESSSELLRVLECQADMMAAEWVSRDLEASNLDKVYVAVDSLAQHFEEADFEATHPPPQQRRLAFQFGMMRHGADAAVAVVDPDERRSLRSYWTALAGRQTGQSDYQWSWSSCQQITHYGIDVLRQVSSSLPNIDFDTDGGTVQISRTFQNHSNRTILLDMAALVYAVPRDTRRTDVGLVVSAVRKRGYVAPGGSFVLRGTIPWYADDHYMPWAVAPPAVGSLIAAYEVSENGEILTPGAVRVKLTKFESELGDALLTFSQHARYDFQSLKGGQRFSDKYSREFDSTRQIPSSIKTAIVEYRTELPRVEADILEGNIEDARARYEELLVSLKRIFPNVRFYSGAGVAKMTTFMISDDLEGELHLDDFTDIHNKFSVSLILKKVRF